MTAPGFQGIGPASNNDAGSRTEFAYVVGNGGQTVQ